ncbi:MAG: winged helix-turn-helix domain-containing protein [Pseudomonadota bacterium]
MSDFYRIGPWIFDAALGTLTREVDESRLEDRAARLLEMLCRHGGELVTHEQIIEDIWDGRSTSTNSIAVVVADIRRALGDPARQPVFIETLPKRGYRLKVLPERVPGAHSGVIQRGIGARLVQPWVIACLGIAVMLVSANFVQDKAAPVAELELTTIAVSNETGSEAYAPLQAAISDLIVFELLRHKQVAISDDESASIAFSGRLIIWSGHPAVSLIARNPDGETVWSGMASGPEDRLPRQVRRQISAFVRDYEASRRRDAS